MARRFKGKQLTKHLSLTGSLSISGSQSILLNSASLSIDGGVNRNDSGNLGIVGNFDAGTFHDDIPDPGSKEIII